eukprot:5639214-Pleurochrysis_carterae.AAC.1
MRRPRWTSRPRRLRCCTCALLKRALCRAQRARRVKNISTRYALVTLPCTLNTLRILVFSISLDTRLLSAYDSAAPLAGAAPTPAFNHERHRGSRCRLKAVLGFLTTLHATWLDDLAIWLPSQLSDYATLAEQGFVITSQGKVATYDLNHDLACRSRLIPLYTFDNPSSRVPQFTFNANNATQPPIGGTGLQARSQSQPSAATSAPGTAPPPASVSALTTLGTTQQPPLTPDESKRFMFAPEVIDAVDRKLMNAILDTISSQASRRAYTASCSGSGRELLRQLAREASLTSTATNATISSMIHALEVRGINEPKVAPFNSFMHSIERLNRALPISSRLPDSVIAEKLANAVRRLGDGISTVLDVRLALSSRVGICNITIAAARYVISNVEARNVQRDLESSAGQRAFLAKDHVSPSRTEDPKRPRPAAGEAWSAKWSKCR